MKTENLPTKTLQELLRCQRIASMDELKRTLGTQVDVTVFRKLKRLSYRTSYSHRGRYYTLDEIISFDERGLWSCQSVWFSRQGTLRRTAAAFVESSEAGYFARELEAELHVTVKDVLLNLVREREIAREKVSGRYLYCSSDPQVKRDQMLRRSFEEEQREITGPFIVILPDELKAAMLLFVSLLDEQQRRLYAGLESLKWGHGGDRRMAELLGLDVGTIAKGRQQLLAEDIEAGRVRKSGAGRKPVEKKRRK